MEAEFTKLAQQLRDSEQFVRAKGPSREEMAEIYSLYKQGTVGDVNIPQPSMWKVLERGKWEAWNSKKGMPKQQAMQQYIDAVKRMLEIKDEEPTAPEPEKQDEEAKEGAKPTKP